MACPVIDPVEDPAVAISKYDLWIVAGTVTDLMGHPVTGPVAGLWRAPVTVTFFKENMHDV